MGTTLRHVVVWWCCLAVLCPTFLLSQLAIPNAASAQDSINGWGEFDSSQGQEQPSTPTRPQATPQVPSAPSAPTSGRPLPDTVNFPAGTDMRVYDKTKAEIEKLREKLDKGEGIRYPTKQPGLHPWYSGNPASETQWKQDSVNAIIGDIAGMAAGGIVPTFSPPDIPQPDQLPPGFTLPGYTPGNATAPLTNALTGAFGDLGKFSPEAMAIFYDCFQPKVTYDIMPDLSLGCPYCPIPTGGKNKYMDLVAKVCGVKSANDNRGYILDFWWPEYEIELNNFAISAFNPTLTCPDTNSPYSRTNLTSQMDALLRPTFLKEKAVQQGVNTLPSFPPELRRGINLGQSAWEGVFATDQTTNLEAHVYRTYLSVASSFSRPVYKDRGYKMPGGECCFYNGVAPTPTFHPIVNGWTEQFPASAFWRTEELSKLLDPEAYAAVRPVETAAVRRIKLTSEIPTGCTAYRAGRDLGNGNDYRDLVSAVNITPNSNEVLKKICYPGGGDLFPVTGKLIGNFNRLPAAAYLARRALYLFGEETSGYGNRPIVSPERRINRFNDRRDKLQRVSPGVSRCFSMQDVPNFLKDGSGNFPNDAIKPEHNGSIRYIYWNHRRTCMCPQIGPAILKFGFLPKCDTIRHACFSMMNGDKPNGDDEKSFTLSQLPSVPSPVPPPGVPYPFFNNKKCPLCPSTSSLCRSSQKKCGPFTPGDYKQLLDESPTWYLWLMRGLSALEAISNPALFFGSSVTSFLAGVPAQLRDQVVDIMKDQAANVREYFVSSLNNIKDLAPELQQQFLELTSQFKTQEGLESYLQSVTGMTKGELQEYLNTLKDLPDELKDKYVDLAKTPEGRQELTRLFNSAAPGDYGRILELGAGMSPSELKKFADSFTSLDPKDRDFLLKLSENGALKGPISDILKEAGPGGVRDLIDLGNTLGENSKPYSDLLSSIRTLDGSAMQQALSIASDPKLRGEGLSLINSISPGALPGFLDLAQDIDPRKLGDTFKNLDDKTANQLNNLIKDPDARRQLIASIEQRTPLELPGIVNFAAGIEKDKFNEVWDSVKDNDKFVAMLKDKEMRDKLVNTFNELPIGDAKGVVNFMSSLPFDKVEEGWKGLSSMDPTLKQNFSTLVNDAQSSQQLLTMIKQVPGVQLPTTIQNLSSIRSDNLKTIWSQLSDPRDFNRIMGDPATGQAFARLTNVFGTNFSSQVGSALKMSDTSLKQLGAALNGVDAVSGNSSQSFSRIVADTTSRGQMEKLANSLTTQQLSGLVQNLGSISNQQFQQFSGIVQSLPPGAQQTVLSTTGQVMGGASDVSKYIDRVGTTTFMKQASSMTPQQLAQEIQKTTPR